MEKVVHQHEFKVYRNIGELKGFEKELLNKAEDFLSLSYSPYSKFRVSTAILLENGEIISGANQENASYPLSLCAERVALHHAAMRFPKEKISLMAIRAKNEIRNDLKPIPPCGACRQVIAEYEKLLNCKIRILLKGDTDEIIEIANIGEILPFVFNGDYLFKPAT